MKITNQSRQVKVQFYGSPLVKLASPQVCSDLVLGKACCIPADIFSNFSEYELKSSLFVSQCRSPKFFVKQKTFLNANLCVIFAKRKLK